MFETASPSLRAPTRRSLKTTPWASRATAVTEPRPSESDELFVETFARGLSVIRCFANRHEPLTIADVSRRAGMARSVARRLLHTLVSLGYASAEAGHFMLQPKTLLLGSAFLSSDSLVELGQSIVNRISSTTGTFSSLNVRQGHETLLVCVAYVVQPNDVDLANPQVGAAAPMYCSASGLLFLSTCSDAELDAYLAATPLRSFTHLTATEPTQLRRRLQRVRDAGYAITDREMSNNLRAISVPVRDRSGRIVAALVSMATPSQATMAGLEAQLPMLRSAALELSAKL